MTSQASWLDPILFPATASVSITGWCPDDQQTRKPLCPLTSLHNHHHHVFSVVQFQPCKVKTVLEMDGADGCTTWMDFKATEVYTRRHGVSGKFHVLYILPQFKKIAFTWLEKKLLVPRLGRLCWFSCPTYYSSFLKIITLIHLLDQEREPPRIPQACLWVPRHMPLCWMCSPQKLSLVLEFRYPNCGFV